MTTSSAVSHRSTTTRRTPLEHHWAATEVLRNSGHPLHQVSPRVLACPTCSRRQRPVGSRPPSWRAPTALRSMTPVSVARGILAATVNSSTCAKQLAKWGRPRLGPFNLLLIFGYLAPPRSEEHT